MASKKSIPLHDQVLLAATTFSGGDVTKEFSAEDLLIEAWRRDPYSWGLRGYEEQHPNAEKIYTEIDRGRGKGGGMVGEGVFEKVRQRVYRMTPLGFARVAELQGTIGGDTEVRARRVVENAILEIIEHPAFRAWLKDPETPKRFRDVSHFWNVAPGTPPNVVRSRLLHVDNTLSGALALLSAKGVDEIAAGRGKQLFDRRDIERCAEFQSTMKSRFRKELISLGAGELID